VKTPESGTEHQTLEIHVLGGGKGESIVIKLPGGLWGVVDCYTHSLTDPAGNPTYQFLKSQGVNRLQFLCLTHPHDDHFMGMVQLIDEFDPLEFWRFDGLSHEHIRKLIKYHELLARKPRLPRIRQQEFTRASEELLGIFSRVLEKARSRTIEPRRFQGRVTALETQSAAGLAVRIESLAPLGRRVEIYEGMILDCIDASGRLTTVLSDPEHNRISLVLLITFGQTRVLLGADLETECWVEVMANVADLHASLVKVCHHGSSNGYCSGLWDRLASGPARKPLAVLTPYHRFKLPEAEAIGEIKAHSSTLYSTCEVDQAALSPSTPPIESRAALRAAIQSRRKLPIARCGMCSFRFDEEGECTIELEAPACEIAG